MPGVYSFGVLHPFCGAFLMSLMVAVIKILFCVLLPCSFGAFYIKVGEVGSIAVSSMAGYATLGLAAF